MKLQGSFPRKNVFFKSRDVGRKAEISAIAGSVLPSGSAFVLYLAQFGKGWW